MYHGIRRRQIQQGQLRLHLRQQTIRQISDFLGLGVPRDGLGYAAGGIEKQQIIRMETAQGHHVQLVVDIIGVVIFHELIGVVPVAPILGCPAHLAQFMGQPLLDELEVEFHGVVFGARKSRKQGPARKHDNRHQQRQQEQAGPQ